MKKTSYGNLIIGDKRYILLSPHPVPGDWERDERRFLVADSRQYNYKNGKQIFRSMHIVASGTWVLELSGVKAIEIEGEEDLEDLENEEYQKWFEQKHNLKERNENDLF